MILLKEMATFMILNPLEVLFAQYDEKYFQKSKGVCLTHYPNTALTKHQNDFEHAAYAVMELDIGTPEYISYAVIENMRAKLYEIESFILKLHERK